MSIDISCDECGYEVKNGEEAYCRECYNRQVGLKERFLDEISSKDQEIESFERDVSELESKILDLENEIRVIKDGEGFPG